jgi:hypothetical protein
MKMKTRSRIALSTLFAAFVLTMTQLASAADVSGTWIMDVQTPAGNGKPTFVLVQKGDNLSGTYKGAMGEAAVTGTVQGNDIVLTYKVSGQGGDLNVKYSGKLEGNSISGKVSLGQYGEGTFKGTKSGS